MNDHVANKKTRLINPGKKKNFARIQWLNKAGCQKYLQKLSFLKNVEKCNLFQLVVLLQNYDKKR